MSRPCAPDAVTNEVVRFRAAGRELEGELVYPEGTAPRGAAVLAGPHPLMGGTRDNNVVRRLGDGLARRGVVTLRFDYGLHGAGSAAERAARFASFWQTSGVPEEDGYLQDLAAALAYAAGPTGAGIAPALIGYSFGCSLLASVPGAEPDAPRVLIAPTVGTHCYDSFTALTAPKLVIAPTDDFAADAELLAEWYGRLPAPFELLRPERDGHFFRGHEDWLVEVVADFLDRYGR